jgi:hypothetical protein
MNIAKLKPENLELQRKIMEGANKAYKKLVIESAERNENLVIADRDGNVLHVPAKDLLKTLPETEAI